MMRIPYTTHTLPPWQLLPALLIGLIIGVLPLELAVVALGGLAVGIAVVSAPIVGIAFALLLGPLWAAEAIYIGGPIGQLSTGQLMLGLTVVVWLAQGLVRGKIVIPNTVLNLPLLLFIVVAGFSITNATSPVDGVKELVKWLEMLLVLWIVLAMCREMQPKRAINLVIFMLLLAGLSQALLGIWQFALRGTGPNHFIIAGNLYRATGTFQQPNPFGGFLSMMLCLAIGTTVGVASKQWDREQVNWRNTIHLLRTTPALTALIVVDLLLLIALIGSWSRGAWINFAFAMMVLIFLLPHTRARGLAFAGTAIIIGFLAWNIGLVPPAFQDRLTSFIGDYTAVQDIRFAGINPQNYSVLERLAHWEAAYGMARDELWRGVGFGNYEAVYDDYRLPDWPDALGHAHNYYLNVLAEAGVGGLIAYLFLWGAIFWHTIQVVRRAPAFERGVALGLLAAWSGISIHHLLDNLYVNNMHIHLGVLLALLIMLQLSVVEQERNIGDHS